MQRALLRQRQRTVVAYTTSQSAAPCRGTFAFDFGTIN